MGACRFTRKDYSEEHAVVFTRRYDERERKIKIEKVREHSSNIKGKLVLDLGCGVGFFSNLYSELGAIVIAVDHADSMVSTTKKRHGEKFHIVQSEAKSLPFKNNLFDVVLALDILEHLYELEIALEEIQRVTKPQSFILITTDKVGLSVGSLPRNMLKNLYINLPTSLQVFIKRVLKWALPFERYQTPLCTHVREYTPSELSQFMGDNGFCLEFMDTFPNRRFFGLWGHLIEFLFRGYLRIYKWDSAIYKFKKEGLKADSSAGRLF